MISGSSVPVADAWGMHGDIGAGWWIVMAVGMALFWGAIIVAVAWALRGGFEGRRPQNETPAQILERRFAEGEISPDDYRERRQALASEGSPGARGPHAMSGPEEGAA